MQEHITSYKLIYKLTADELESTVQEHINQRYEPLGAPFVLTVDMAHTFYQAMIKREYVG